MYLYVRTGCVHMNVDHLFVRVAALCSKQCCTRSLYMRAVCMLCMSIDMYNMRVHSHRVADKTPSTMSLTSSSSSVKRLIERERVHFAFVMSRRGRAHVLMQLLRATRAQVFPRSTSGSSSPRVPETRQTQSRVHLALWVLW